MKTIKLTDKQFETLERLLDYEIEQEYIYQSNGDKDTELLEDYIDLYEALYTKQARSFIEAIVFEDLVESKKKLLGELKNAEEN